VVDRTAFFSALVRSVETLSTAPVFAVFRSPIVLSQCWYLTGNITLGEILEILPFEDPVVVLELDGETIWAALEASLATWPSHEGLVVLPQDSEVIN